MLRRDFLKSSIAIAIVTPSIVQAAIPVVKLNPFKDFTATVFGTNGFKHDLKIIGYSDVLDPTAQCFGVHLVVEYYNIISTQILKGMMLRLPDGSQWMYKPFAATVPVSNGDLLKMTYALTSSKKDLDLTNVNNWYSHRHLVQNYRNKTEIKG